MPRRNAGQVVTGAAIAADAQRWTGRGYVFGGTAASPGDWDCSSFVSWVLGHDLGLPLPGGQWGGPGMPPNSHGPVVDDYAAWDGATPVAGGQEAAGDLVVWVGAGASGHMGIVTGPGRMVSALNPQLGTLASPIAGYGPTNTWQFRRLVNVTPGASVGAATTAATSGPSTLVALLVGLGATAAMVAAVLALAAASGLAGEFALLWAAKKATEG